MKRVRIKHDTPVSDEGNEWRTFEEDLGAGLEIVRLGVVAVTEMQTLVAAETIATIVSNTTGKGHQN